MQSTQCANVGRRLQIAVDWPKANDTVLTQPNPWRRPGVWALARFLHRNELPGEKEKNALAGTRLRLFVWKPRGANALCSLGKAFFSFSPALGTHGAQKRAKAHIPGPFKTTRGPPS